jgi:hypothetical protein
MYTTTSCGKKGTSNPMLLSVIILLHPFTSYSLGENALDYQTKQRRSESKLVTSI